jgi:hypothetical protein
LVYFLKFIIHKINCEMVKSVMMVLTDRENADATNTDYDYELDAEALMIEREREN